MSRRRQDKAIIKLVIYLFIISLIISIIGAGLKFVEQWWLLILLAAGILFLVQYVKKRRKTRQEREAKEAQLRQSWEIVAAHIEELSVKEQQLTFNEGYGLKNTKKWEAEKLKFLENVIKPTINERWLLGYGEDAILSAIDDEIKLFREKSPVASTQNYSENISPVEYEQFCAKLLNDSGWIAHTTVATGDQGADVVATKEGIRLVVQCKKYSSPVGNKAVQEAHAAMSFYNASKAIVVSNTSYTLSAKQAAGKIGVLLLHHDDLPNLAALLIA